MAWVRRAAQADRAASRKRRGIEKSQRKATIAAAVAETWRATQVSMQGDMLDTARAVAQPQAATTSWAQEWFKQQQQRPDQGDAGVFARHLLNELKKQGVLR